MSSLSAIRLGRQRVRRGIPGPLVRGRLETGV